MRRQFQREHLGRRRSGEPGSLGGANRAGAFDRRQGRRGLARATHAHDCAPDAEPGCVAPAAHVNDAASAESNRDATAAQPQRGPTELAQAGQPRSLSHLDAHHCHAR